MAGNRGRQRWGGDWREELTRENADEVARPLRPCDGVDFISRAMRNSRGA